MCFGGGSSSVDNPADDPAPPQYAAQGAQNMEQAQLIAQQDIADQNTALQEQIANQQEEQAQQTLAYQEQQSAQAQAEAQQQADLQTQYDQSRNQLAQQATDWVNQTFSQYNQDYYNQYAQDYQNALTPTIDQQYGQAKGNMLFGLARAGQLNSQTHADQQGLLDQTRGQAYATVATQATQAAQNLQQQVGQAQNSLLSQILSTGALGQPVAPGSIDDINANIANTGQAIQQIQSSGQDQLAKIGQLPTPSTLGNVFGGLASTAGNAIAGNNLYQIGAGAGYGSAGYGTGANAPGLG